MSQFPLNSIRIVAANGRVITKLACLAAQRWFDPELSAAHAVDKFPNSPAHVLANSFPLGIVELSPTARHIGAVRISGSIQPLVEPRAFAAQGVISAATQFKARQE